MIWRAKVKRKSMTTQQVFKSAEKAEIKKIGKRSVVVLPLKTWIALEDYLEDRLAEQSPAFVKRIAKARAEKKTYSLSEIKKEFGL